MRVIPQGGGFAAAWGDRGEVFVYNIAPLLKVKEEEKKKKDQRIPSHSLLFRALMMNVTLAKLELCLGMLSHRLLVTQAKALAWLGVR